MTTVAFVGPGAMGSRMAFNLLRAAPNSWSRWWPRTRTRSAASASMEGVQEPSLIVSPLVSLLR